MKIRVITGVLVTTVLAIGAGDCFAQNVKTLAKDNGSKSAPIYNSKNGHYYEFVGEKELTWPQAKQRAASRYLVVNGRKLRGYLVTLTSKDEQELLAKHYLDPPDVHTDVWMGGNDDKVDDDWRWVTGPEAKEDGGKGRLFFKGRDAIGYTNWLGREPNNSGGVESFLQWNHVPSPRIPPGKWNDQPIDKPGSKGYFVEYDASISETLPIHNPKNGHYYEFVGDKELTWPQAKQRAESRVLIIGGKQLRGYLVTLTSKDEQELLAKHYLDPPDVHTDVWMGGNDDKVDDEWRWVTGPEAKADGGKGKLFFKGRDAIGYTNWLGREPNNSGGVESFLQWNHVPSPRIPPGKWNDQPIDKPGSKGYFVEYGGAVDGQSKPGPKG